MKYTVFNEKRDICERFLNLLCLFWSLYHINVRINLHGCSPWASVVGHVIRADVYFVQSSRVVFEAAVFRTTSIWRKKKYNELRSVTENVLKNNILSHLTVAEHRGE